MERRTQVFKLGSLSGPLLCLNGVKLFDPGATRRGEPAAARTQRGKRSRDPAHKLGSDRALGALARGRGVQNNQLGVLTERSAEAEAEVKLRSDHEGNISALQRG